MTNSKTHPLGRILVVDDEPALRSVISKMSTDLGYETTNTGSAREALNILAEENYDILLSDIVMPEMNGIELLKAAFRLDRYLVGVLMTGYQDVQTAKEAIRIGAFDYIEKPFSQDAFAAVLSRAMNMQRLKSDNIQLREAISIYELAQKVSSSFDVDIILDELSRAAQELVEADEVSIMIFDDDEKKKLRIAAARGEYLQPFVGTYVSAEEGIAAWVVKNQKVLTLNGSLDGNSYQSRYSRGDIFSAVSVPIHSSGKLVGILNVKMTRNQRLFRKGQIKGLSVLTSIVAPIIDNARLFRKMYLAEEKYRDIFNNAIEGLYQATKDKVYISSNRALAHIYGFASPEELISGIHDIEREQFVDPSCYRDFVTALLKEGSVENYETQLYRKDRSIIWVALSGRTVRDGEGKILYFEGSCQDITARKNAEEGLKVTVDKLKKATEAVINTLVVAVEARDPYTAGHQKRVSNLAVAIAKKIGLSSERIEGIRVSGMIHDLGKIAIPAEILSLPRKLTELEFTLVKTHPTAGFDIIKDVEFPWPVAQTVLQHHERFNGSGYPHGIRGDQMLLEARIIAVADVVEAMASHRPYRPSLGIDAALEEIKRNKGIYYDSEVVDLCLDLFKRDGFRFE